MFQKYLILLLFYPLLSSCSESTTASLPEEYATKKNVQPPAFVEGDDNRVVFTQAHPKIKNLLDFCRDNPQFSPYFIDSSFGASIPREPFLNDPLRKDLTMDGLRGWFCYDETNNKIFLAFEYEDNWDPQNPDHTAKTDSVICPSPYNIFGCTRKSEYIENYLTSHTPNYDGKYIKISRNQLSIYTNAFLNKFGKNINNTFIFKGKSCFFNDADGLRRAELDTYLNQTNIRNIRYYFGFDRSDPKHLDYGLRVYLFGVNDQNKILAQNNQIILQKSWPPRVP